MNKHIPAIASIVVSLFLFSAILTILIDDYRNATSSDWIIPVVNTTLLVILGIFLAVVNYSLIKMEYKERGPEDER